MTSLKRRFAVSSAASLLAMSAVAATTVAVAPTAAAGCPVETFYSISSPTTVWKRTSLSSAYITGPGSVALTKGRQWSVSASMTATVSAEAGIIFAKASTSLGITVGASYTGHQSLTYTLNVPKGKTLRLQQYKSARRFVVTKARIMPTCKTQVIWRSTVIAPVKSNQDKYFRYALVS